MIHPDSRMLIFIVSGMALSLVLGSAIRMVDRILEAWGVSPGRFKGVVVHRGKPLNGLTRLLKSYALLFKVRHLRSRIRKLELKLSNLPTEIRILSALREKFLLELEDLVLPKK